MKTLTTKEDIEKSINHLKSYYSQALEMKDGFLARNIKEMLEILGVKTEEINIHRKVI